MAYQMGPCWNCGYPVGLKIRVCPFCGARLKRSVLAVAMTVIFVLGVVGLMVFLAR